MAMPETLFAASIHEIKNRFGLLQNELEGLLGTIDASDAQQQSAARIRHEAQFIGSELVRVLSLFKSASGRLQAVIDQQFPDEFLEDIGARHATTAHATGCRISTECNDEFAAFFDESLATIILDTCIYNAVKAGARQIILRGEEGEGEFLIHVDDNGPGFPTALIEAFEAGTQGSGSIDVGGHSTGLGLFLARQLAAAHHDGERRGELRLGRAPEGGARVTLAIPQ